VAAGAVGASRSSRFSPGMSLPWAVIDPLAAASRGRGFVGSSRRRQPGTLGPALEADRTVGFLAAIIVELPPVSSHLADFVVPNDSTALKGGADEGIRDPMRMCPKGLLIRRRSERRGAGVLWSWVESRGPS
jgi:hypothetical protein